MNSQSISTGPEPKFLFDRDQGKTPNYETGSDYEVMRRRGWLFMSDQQNDLVLRMIQGWGEERPKPVMLERKRTVHFNVMYKGSGMASRILAREIVGSRPSEIEWVLMVEEGRKATLTEIRLLCAGKWEG